MASRMTKADMADKIAEQAELIEELRALIQAQNEAVADEAIEKTYEVDETVFDKVNRRVNEYGEILNCRIAEGCERLNLRIAAKALRTTLAPRHSEPRTDRNGRTWIDFYPSVETAGEIAA